ncbi:hypothetical protein F4778DRAFT_346560 [Xylariomycetidae sp. FL2044]|nr:hypothetical protein F4778DRAFT_346560 [Xylariomycetidae sp. FL2044]
MILCLGSNINPSISAAYRIPQKVSGIIIRHRGPLTRKQLGMRTGMRHIPVSVRICTLYACMYVYIYFAWNAEGFAFPLDGTAIRLANLLERLLFYCQRQRYHIPSAATILPTYLGTICITYLPTAYLQASWPISGYLAFQNHGTPYGDLSYASTGYWTLSNVDVDTRVLTDSRWLPVPLILSRVSTCVHISLVVRHSDFAYPETCLELRMDSR